MHILLAYYYLLIQPLKTIRGLDTHKMFYEVTAQMNTSPSLPIILIRFA